MEGDPGIDGEMREFLAFLFGYTLKDLCEESVFLEGAEEREECGPGRRGERSRGQEEHGRIDHPAPGRRREKRVDRSRDFQKQSRRECVEKRPDGGLDGIWGFGFRGALAFGGR